MTLISMSQHSNNLAISSCLKLLTMAQNQEMTLLKDAPAPFMAVFDFNSSKLKSLVPQINSYIKRPNTNYKIITLFTSSSVSSNIDSSSSGMIEFKPSKHYRA